MIDSIGHMFGLLGTLQNLRIQCECVTRVVPQQLYTGLKCKTKHCSVHGLYYGVFV